MTFADLPRTTVASPPSLAGRRALVLGLGRFGGGVGVTRWLKEQGADVTVSDLANEATLAASRDAIADLDITLRLGGHELADLDGMDLVIVNPAINKKRSTIFAELIRREMHWTTEINLFCERCPAPVIGVTGTYGKSTTCAMLAQMLDACRTDRQADFARVHLGGNIGHSLLADLDQIGAEDVVVLELSDTQLADLPRIAWTPAIAVITNLAPHHLDRYPCEADYFDAKLNIIGDASHTWRVFAGNLVKPAMNRLMTRVAGAPHRLIPIDKPAAPLPLKVPGAHNQANAACALAIGECLQIDEMAMRASLCAFAALPHRLQHVRTVHAVNYINDSKSTSPSATITALSALHQPVVAIVGGCLRPVSQTDFARALVQACRAIICMGESGALCAEAVRSAMSDASDRGRAVIVKQAASMEDAVRLAQVEAVAGDIVLFSPGAPSFDQYANFVERGKAFEGAVRRL